MGPPSVRGPRCWWRNHCSGCWGECGDCIALMDTLESWVEGGNGNKWSTTQSQRGGWPVRRLYKRWSWYLCSQAFVVPHVFVQSAEVFAFPSLSILASDEIPCRRTGEMFLVLSLRCWCWKGGTLPEVHPGGGLLSSSRWLLVRRAGQSLRSRMLCAARLSPYGQQGQHRRRRKCPWSVAPRSLRGSTAASTVAQATIGTIVDVDVTGGGGVLPYISYIGMCHPKGYGFWAVLVWKRV